MNRQEELLTERGRGGERDARAAEPSAIQNRGQAAISLMPGVDGTGSGLQLEGSKVGDLLYVLFG